MEQVYVLKCTISGTGDDKIEQPYAFRDLLRLARFYQKELGFDKETIRDWLNIARSYWKEVWEEMQQGKSKRSLNSNG